MYSWPLRLAWLCIIFLFHRGEFQLTSVLEQMRYEDDGTLGCVIHGDALDMGIPGPYVATMGSFAMPHLV